LRGSIIDKRCCSLDSTASETLPGAIALLSAVAGAIYVNLYRKKLGGIDTQEFLTPMHHKKGS
jgi:hypothetical protein